MMVSIDHEKCQGHANCIRFGPDVFELDVEGYNRMAPFEPAAEHREKVELAARMCPERAIKIAFR